ncbi:secreted RxLR effector protein 161-like [Nicotiana sylvestris]|uniref:secreted RxLR effector protein 161-like n=1 Tax=Nicotiana sylvestris TaxID=4096 RepID=UPI00388C91D5
MQDELNQLERSQVWHLVPRPKDRSVIGTKWVFRNKLDEDGTVTRNKTRLVVQGYSQEEGIDYDETFAPVAGLEKLYRGMIDSLLYLTASRPDIIFSVGLCAHFQANIKESHLAAVERILRYLKGTTDLCLWYPEGSNFNLVGYADADYAGFLVDRKNTSDMARFLGSCLVSWATNKQNLVALSTAEAEYVATASCCDQLLWIN